MIIIKGFALNDKGDVIIENGNIQMAHGAELTKQTIKTVLGTQKGEWFLNWNEGIDHNSILGKRRYASQNSAIDNQYIAEIEQLKSANSKSEQTEQALNKLLEKRLDGVD